MCVLENKTTVREFSSNDAQQDRAYISEGLHDLFKRAHRHVELLQRAPNAITLGLFFNVDTPMQRVIAILDALAKDLSTPYRFYFKTPRPPGLEPCPKPLVDRMLRDDLFLRPQGLSKRFSDPDPNVGEVRAMRQKCEGFPDVTQWTDMAPLNRALKRPSASPEERASTLSKAWLACNCTPDVEHMLAHYYTFALPNEWSVGEMSLTYDAHSQLRIGTTAIRTHRQSRGL